MPWLFANMPRAIPALNLGPGVKGEIGSCKQEADQPEASPRSEPEASPRSRPEASRPRSRPEASRPEASPRSSEGALTPPLPEASPRSEEGLDPTPPQPATRPMLLDEHMASRQLSPKLHAWQAPEIRTFVVGLEDFLQNMGERQSLGQLAREATMVAVLMRGVRGLFGIEEHIYVYVHVSPPSSVQQWTVGCRYTGRQIGSCEQVGGQLGSQQVRVGRQVGT